MEPQIAPTRTDSTYAYAESAMRLVSPDISHHNCYPQTMYWLILFVAVFIEILWALTLRSLSIKITATMIVACVLLTALNMVLLTWAMRGIPASTAYAVWTGLGAVGLTCIGALYLKEPADPIRFACIGLVIVGVIGLKLTAKA